MFSSLVYLSTHCIDFSKRRGEDEGGGGWQWWGAGKGKPEGLGLRGAGGALADMACRIAAGTRDRESGEGVTMRGRVEGRRRPGFEEDRMARGKGGF